MAIPRYGKLARGPLVLPSWCSTVRRRTPRFSPTCLAWLSFSTFEHLEAIVKMIDLSRASKQEKDDALKESQVLSRLKHPYIVRYRESFNEDGSLLRIA
eukprot:6256118-Amphidinium_carterae.2